MGAIVARFHLLADTCASVNGGADVSEPATDELVFGLRERAMREAGGSFPEAEITRWADTVSDRYLAATARVRGSRLPRTIVHGDVTPRNVLFQGDEVTNLVDFDFVRKGEAIIDLAVGLIKLTAPNLELANFRTARPTRRAAHIDIPRARVFFDGYRDVKSLAREEIESLPEHLSKTWVERAAWLSSFFSPHSHLRVLGELAASLDWLEGNAGKLVEALSANQLRRVAEMDH